MSVLQLRRYQRKDADLDAVAASGVAAAWTAYTPTVTASSGTFTTIGAAGYSLTIGKITFLRILIIITTNGTAAGNVQATLPVNASVQGDQFTGRETALTGKVLQGEITTTKLIMYNYDNTYPGGSGATLKMSGFYESV